MPLNGQKQIRTAENNFKLQINKIVVNIIEGYVVIVKVFVTTITITKQNNQKIQRKTRIWDQL